MIVHVIYQWVPSKIIYRADTGFRKKKGGGGSGQLLSTKTWRICEHGRDVYPLYDVWGSPKTPPPPGSAPEKILEDIAGVVQNVSIVYNQFNLQLAEPVQ